MIGNNMTICIEDDVTKIEKLLAELESWSNQLFSSDWRDIECSGFDSPAFYERSKNEASKRSYERLLVIEKLREKLLCE